MSADFYDSAKRFAALFDGLKIAYGTGKGSWVKRPLGPQQYVAHLRGEGSGIGVAPLREDSTVAFAAIDLDEPDFGAARAMQEFIPGASFIERSRSGNAHVWVFFSGPLEAWVAMGILKEATIAAGKEHVEVFPKNHDFAKVKLGNYINLPYHGDQRKVVEVEQVQELGGERQYIFEEWPLERFLHEALLHRNDPEDWRKRARWLLIDPPSERTSSHDGPRDYLHGCAERIIAGEAGSIPDGHRNAIFFMLARNLMNWSQCDHDEALMYMRQVNEQLCEPPAPDAEVRRILANVERGGYRSTGCDDPLVLPFADPKCPIAHPRRS